MSESPPNEDRTADFWSWFAVALFVLITIDLLTTMGAAIEYGIEDEVNPVMRFLLAEGPWVTAGIHLLIVIVVTVAFSGVLSVVNRAPEPHRSRLEFAVEVWLGLLIAVGLFIFANNISAIILGDSLL